MSKLSDISQLVIDEQLYPRESISANNILRLRDAIAANNPLPPILADAKSKIVIDGLHRIRAYQAEGVKLAPVTFRTYDDRASMFLDAARSNARHGQKLNRVDQVRIMTIAEQLKIDGATICAAISIPFDRAAKLVQERAGKNSRGEAVPLKHAWAGRWNGRQLPKHVAAAHKRSQGFPAVYHARQILTAEEGDIIDWSDQKTRAVMLELLELLSERL